MDGKQFDDLSRRLSSALTRRRALGGAIAGAIGLAAPSAISARSKRKTGATACTTGCLAGGIICLTGTDRNLCGSNGLACVQCGNGQVCEPLADGSGGRCAQPLNCEPPNIFTGAPGKCQVSGQCVTNGDKTSCGTTNQPINNGPGPTARVCTTVCGNGQQCSGSADNSVCAVQQCTSGTCSNGCCNGNTCVTAGSNATLCGTGGGTCVNCQTQFGATAICQANGICSGPPPQTCSSANCTGCCQGTACINSTSKTQCGKNGSACVSCGGSKKCKSGTCKKKKKK